MLHLRAIVNKMLLQSEVYPRPSQTSEMELFAKILKFFLAKNSFSGKNLECLTEF